MQGEFISPVAIKEKGPLHEPSEAGREGNGQNARLAAKLTGFKIDIRPESAPEPPEEENETVEE